VFRLRLSLYTARMTPAQAPPRTFRYYDLVMAGFVTVLLCSNLIGPGKSCAITMPDWLPIWAGAALVFGAGNIFFPFSYIFGDILTEVYGYARARRVIWAGFGALIFAAVMGWTVIWLPVDPNEKYNEIIQPALEVCFGGTWRIVIASAIAFWVGDFANSYVLAKLKVITKGRFLWVRTISSTMVGQGLDSLIFYPIALASWAPLLTALGVTDPDILRTFGGWNAQTVMQVVAFNWFMKTMVEVVMTPATYAIVGFLKRREGIDHYDIGTNFTPFTLKD
jgi:queuosine precursor transporter